ncbi:hypothetical protein SEA_BLUENGOLD_191 [Gordonia phage BlueNGold]|nr:hypothetical protein SEA_BLUENGOLD_191 [Gordonia phage BlueNGold]
MQYAKCRFCGKSIKKSDLTRKVDAWRHTQSGKRACDPSAVATPEKRTRSIYSA